MSDSPTGQEGAAMDHQLKPGIDVDMVTEGRSPDPRWCNVCGEAHSVSDDLDLPALLAKCEAATPDSELAADIAIKLSNRCDHAERRAASRLTRAEVKVAAQDLRVVLREQAALIGRIEQAEAKSRDASVALGKEINRAERAEAALASARAMLVTVGLVREFDAVLAAIEDGL